MDSASAVERERNRVRKPLLVKMKKAKKLQMAFLKRRRSRMLKEAGARSRGFAIVPPPRENVVNSAEPVAFLRNDDSLPETLKETLRIRCDAIQRLITQLKAVNNLVQSATRLTIECKTVFVASVESSNSRQTGELIGALEELQRKVADQEVLIAEARKNLASL